MKKQHMEIVKNIVKGSLIGLPIYLVLGAIIGAVVLGLFLPPWLTFILTLAVSLPILYFGFKIGSWQLFIVGVVLVFASMAIARASVTHLSMIASLVSPF